MKASEHPKGFRLAFPSKSLHGSQARQGMMGATQRDPSNYKGPAVKTMPSGLGLSRRAHWCTGTEVTQFIRENPGFMTTIEPNGSVAE